MSDPVAPRVARVHSILRDPGVEERERLARAIEAISGLSSTEVSSPDWTRIKRPVARVNEVLRRYPIETAGDSERIAPSDLATIRAHLTSFSRWLRDPESPSAEDGA